jgi:hypothetical protein
MAEALRCQEPYCDQDVATLELALIPGEITLSERDVSHTVDRLGRRAYPCGHAVDIMVKLGG